MKASVKRQFDRRTFFKSASAAAAGASVLGVLGDAELETKKIGEEVVKAHLKPGTPYFAPTPEWNDERSWDHLWS
jgi:hypothetical protein